MRTVLRIALAATLLACHNGPSAGSPPSRKLGSYSFRISMTGREPVGGAFTITRDSVTVMTGGQEGGRDLTRTSPAPMFHIFSCFPPADFDRFGVTIDADHPFSSSWSMMQSVMKTRTVCVRYIVTERGARVCAESRAENYFEDVRSGGRLILIAADTLGRP